MRPSLERHDTDILILGSGGAGLLRLYAQQAAPHAKVTIAVKGLIGKCGCTRWCKAGTMLLVTWRSS